MKKKVFLIMMTLGFLGSANAHDEGHGPKLADTGKYGGLVSAVVQKQDAKIGSKAALVHKAELVRSSDGTVRLYLYNEKMSPLDIKSFTPLAAGSLASKVKGKLVSKSFNLESKNGIFSGKMPKPESIPYSIDVVLKDGSKELLTAFDNLD